MTLHTIPPGVGLLYASYALHINTKKICILCIPNEQKSILICTLYNIPLVLGKSIKRIWVSLPRVIYVNFTSKQVYFFEKITQKNMRFPLRPHKSINLDLIKIGEKEWTLKSIN